ncbi:MAG: hypothetical protein AAF628_12525 [Planctomycetota bacterium]
MRRTLVVISLLAIVLGGYATWRALESDSTRIRRQLDRAITALNDARTLACTDVLALDYRDDTTQIDRETLRRGLLYLRQRDAGAPGRSWPWHASIDESELSLDVDRDAQPRTARVEGVVCLTHTRPDAPREVRWEARLIVDWRNGDRGWEVVRTTHETLRGARPR